MDRFGRSDVHCCRETVVGALSTVHMIIGMNGRLAPARAASELVGATRDDFVDVHVALRAAAGLPDH